MTTEEEAGATQAGKQPTCEEPAARQYGLVSRAQARALGLSKQAITRRLGTGRWERLALKVYRVAGAPESWFQQLLLALLWAGQGAAISHRVAAALLGLDGFKRDVVEVSVAANRLESPAGRGTPPWGPGSGGKRNLLTAQGRAVLQITWEDLTDRAEETGALLTPMFSMPGAGRG